MPRSVLNNGGPVAAAVVPAHAHDPVAHTHDDEATRLAAGSYLKIEHGDVAWRIYLEPETTHLQSRGRGGGQ